MADTVNIEITKADWTLAVSVGSKGLLSGQTGTGVITRKADAKPSASEEFGHQLKSNGSINVDLSDAAETGNLYARLDVVYNGQSDGTVVFTEA